MPLRWDIVLILLRLQSQVNSQQQGDPRRQQDDNDNHDTPGQRISSPIYVDLEIVHGTAPSQQHPVHFERLGGISLRFLALEMTSVLGSMFNHCSTLHSLSIAMMIGSDGGADPTTADLPAVTSASEDRQQ